MQWSERLPAVVLAVLIVLLGIQPSWLIGRSEATIATLEPSSRLVKTAADPPLPFPFRSLLMHG